MAGAKAQPWLAAHWRHPVADYPMTGDHANDVTGLRPACIMSAGGYRDADVVIEVFDTGTPTSVAARTGVPGTRPTTRLGGLVREHFSFTVVVGHLCCAVELVGGLGTATEPGQ